jgi:hypothetical protein
MSTVTVQGPIFSGPRAAAVVADMLAEARHKVATQGLAEVHIILDRSIRNPTPYYETQLTVQDMGTTDLVHDRDIIYGPWLEGVGSRNRTTRFKGYAAFRRATQQLDPKVPGLIAPIVARHARRLT